MKVAKVDRAILGPIGNAGARGPNGPTGPPRVVETVMVEGNPVWVTGTTPKDENSTAHCPAGTWLTGGGYGSAAPEAASESLRTFRSLGTHWPRRTLVALQLPHDARLDLALARDHVVACRHARTDEREEAHDEGDDHAGRWFTQAHAESTLECRCSAQCDQWAMRSPCVQWPEHVGISALSRKRVRPAWQVRDGLASKAPRHRQPSSVAR